MLLMERVREIGADESRVEDASVRAARQVLTREIARNVRPDRVHRRWRALAGMGIGGLAAGAAVTAIVVGSVVAPPAAPSASAADVLNDAAKATLTATVLDPAPGQYIRIQEVSTLTIGWTAEEESPDGGFWDSRESGTTASVRQSRSLYVPADRSDDWVEDYAESTELLALTGPDAEQAEKGLDQLEFSVRVEVYPGGLQSITEVDGAEPGTVDQIARNGLSCYYDEMPREPRLLVEWLDNYAYTTPSACPPPQITEPVDFNLAPAELRATMFQALALVDGARVERIDGDITTIAFPDGGESNWMETVNVDTAQGLIVGRGTVDADSWASRINVTIVDEIPGTVPVP